MKLPRYTEWFGAIGSADWQAAVSQIDNPRTLDVTDAPPTASRRYSRLPSCATIRCMESFDLQHWTRLEAMNPFRRGETFNLEPPTSNPQFANLLRPLDVECSRLNVGCCPFMERAGHTLSSCHARPAQRGVALVITIIMLSIITVMTVAFLALARRD